MATDHGIHTSMRSHSSLKQLCIEKISNRPHVQEGLIKHTGDKYEFPGRIEQRKQIEPQMVRYDTS